MSQESRQKTIDTLLFYGSAIDDLRRVVDQHPLDLGQKLKAQQSLKNLKEHLTKEYARRTLKRAQAELTDPEREVLLPAVGRALDQLRIRWNSIPDSDWLLQLNEAKLEISDALSALDRD